MGLEGRGVALLIHPPFATGTCNAGSEFNTELECLDCDPEILLVLVEDERKWNLSGTCVDSGADKFVI